MLCQFSKTTTGGPWPDITLRVNGSEKKVSVSPETPLLWVLRDTLELTGTKFGCGAGLVRRLHRPRRRQSDSLLLDSGFASRGQERDYD